MTRTREFDTDKVIEAIAERFWADGYEATGIADLVETTGVGRASLYGAFGSKREMLTLAIDWYMTTRLEPMVSVVEEGGLDAAIGFLKNFTLARANIPEKAAMGCMVVNMTAELAMTDAEMPELAGAYRERLRRAFATALTSAERNGEISGPIEQKVEIATLMTLGMFVALRGGADLEEVARLVDSAVEVLESWRVN